MAHLTLFVLSGFNLRLRVILWFRIGGMFNWTQSGGTEMSKPHSADLWLFH
jgi:hypothetical protein